MTFNEFVDKYIGKKIDYDGAYAGQCVDLFRQYIKDCLSGKQPKLVKGAADFWSNYDSDPNLKKYFDKFANTLTAVPQKGDVVIWNKRVGKGYGHVAIFLEGDVNSFTSLDQNWPTLSKVTRTKHDYKNIYGWLRYKNMINSDNSATPGGDMTNELKACLEALHGEKGVIKEKEALQRKYDENIEKFSKTLAEKQNEIDSLKPKVNTAESKAQEWEINFKELVNSLASKLSCKHDRAAITAEVEGLITIEDQKTSIEGELIKTQQALEGLQEIAHSLRLKIKELKEGGENTMAKKKIDLRKALWEVAKEPLRWLVLAILPVLATHLAQFDMKWAVYATIILRIIDKSSYEVNKIDPKTNVIKLPF